MARRAGEGDTSALLLRRKVPQVRSNRPFRQPSGQHGQYGLADRRRLRPRFVTPEAKNRIAGIVHEVVAAPVVLVFGVLAAVEFDDEPMLPASKVGKIRSDGELPNEFETAELAVLQLDPQPALGQIVALAQRASAPGRAGTTAQIPQASDMRRAAARNG